MSESLNSRFLRIQHILERVHEGDYVLPEFQRSFVWSNSDIKDLLVSCLNGYFIGTFLLLRGDAAKSFKTRYFEGVPEANPQIPREPDDRTVDRIVLDGQQRITAAYYALYAPPGITPKGASYPRRYLLRIENCHVGDIDWEDLIEDWSENESSRKVPHSSGAARLRELIQKHDFVNLLNDSEFRKYLFENHLLPFAVLKSDSDFSRWLDDYADYLEEKGIEKAQVRERKQALRERLKNVLNFQVAVLELEERDLVKVVDLFERINRTGVALSVFALATAVYMKGGVNLRRLWREFYAASPTIQQFCQEDDETYPKYVLQVMALLQGKEVKKKVLIDSRQLSVTSDRWSQATELLEKALDRATSTRNGYGAIKSNLLPYRSAIVTLAALLAKCGTASDFDKLDAWYWSSVFTARYAGASETAIKQDYDQVCRWLKDGTQEPSVVTEAANRVSSHKLENIRTGGTYKAILCLISLAGAKDFLTGQSPELGLLNDHHIFPKSLYRDRRSVDSILNRTLITDTTNRDISNKRPSEYVREIIKALGGEEDDARDMLKSHLIDDECFEAMKQDDYSRFMARRAELIRSEMIRRIRYGS